MKYRDFMEQEAAERGMEKAVFIDGTREGYSPAQVGEQTLTVGELIAILSECDEDAKVFLMNDRGYTFGHIGWETITGGAYDPSTEGDEEYTLDE